MHLSRHQKALGELHRSILRASRRLLSTQLKQLTEQGIIIKTKVLEKPLKVEYKLTLIGQTLIPFIETTAQWGETHREILEPVFQSPVN